MTRRILAGFIAVLLAVLAAVVVPLGIVLTGQQSRDFRDATRGAARAIAALAEEQLNDHANSSELASAVSRIVVSGDSLQVLDATGSTIARLGPPIDTSTLAAARAGRALPAQRDRIAVSVPVGDRERTAGWVVLIRSSAPAEQRRRDLWLALTAASLVALLLGAAIAASLARWIARPLRSLIDTARHIGAGDVTARAEDQLGPPEVRDVAGAFNDMADRVARLLEVQRGMTAEVSHQLRTPLAAMRLRLELLVTEVRADQTGEVAAIIAETSRLARLVDGLLAVARAEATPSKPSPIALASVVEARLTAWEPVAGERQVSLTRDAASVRAIATPGHVEQILDNLIDNALEALHAGGQINVSVRNRHGLAILTVADNGPGMSREQISNAFERYVTDRAGDGGTGLGLAVIDRLVATDGGSIKLFETLGGGVTVEVSLPATN